MKGEGKEEAHENESQARVHVPRERGTRTGTEEGWGHKQVVFFTLKEKKRWRGQFSIPASRWRCWPRTVWWLFWGGVAPVNGPCALCPSQPGPTGEGRGREKHGHP